MSLANIKLQVGVIASSFQYIKNNLMKGISLDSADRVKFEEELRKTQNTLQILKNEIRLCRKLAQEVKTFLWHRDFTYNAVAFNTHFISAL